MSESLPTIPPTPPAPLSHIPPEVIDQLIQAAMARIQETHATVSDRVVASAQSLPDLIQKASVSDPALASMFTGKALIASKTPWGTLAGGIVAYVAGRYGFQWDQATCDLVAGAGVLLASFVMRYISPLPVTGILTAATPAQAAAATITKGPTA